MTGRIFSKILLNVGLLLSLGLVFAPAASAQDVAATANAVQQTGQGGGILDVQFRIEVTNGESSVASGLLVVFEDGQQVFVGDVDAGGGATTDPVTRTIDHSALPTRHFPVPVTLRFALNGANVELPATLILNLDVPEGAGE